MTMVVTALADTAGPGPATPHGSFREQVRAALGEPEVREELELLARAGVREPDVRPLYRALARRDLLAVNWPEQYGGCGRSLADAAIVAEELVRAGVPDILHVNSVQIVGLFLLLAGTPEQKARHLPGLAAARTFASVLYTEPGTGSDLAALETVAVRVDGGFELSGTKAFSLKSDITDLGLCAARTGEPGDRYRGITLFLVDLHAEGVHREVVNGIADEQFHRIRLDGVRVAARDVIGPVGGGWPLLTKALSVERTGLDYSLKAERWYAASLAALRAAGSADEHLVEIGRLGGEVEAGRLLSWDVIAALTAGADAPDDVAAATAKYLTSEVAQQVAGWANRLTGGPADGDSAWSAVLEAAYREAPGLTLSAGTSEVMLQIIASANDRPAGAPDGDPLLSQLREAVRDRLGAAVRERDRDTLASVHGPAALQGADCPGWPFLVGLGAPGFEAPAEAGGFDLGLGASVMVCEELGRCGLGGPYRSVALASDILHRAVPAPRAGELPAALARGAVTVGAGVLDPGPAPTSRPTDTGWELSGSWSVDDAGAGLLLLAVRTDAGTAMALVPADRPGWSAVAAGDGTARLRLDGLAVGREEIVLGPSDTAWEGLVARARIRQAAYLLGVATGAHAGASAYTARRHQFGVPLHDHQAVAFALAGLKARLVATGLAVRRAASLADEGRTAARAAVDALALAAELALDATRTAVHFCGVRGLTAQLGVQRHYRLARVEAVRLGTPQRLWREAARLRLVDHDGLDLLTDLRFTARGPHTG